MLLQAYARPCRIMQKTVPGTNEPGTAKRLKERYKNIAQHPAGARLIFEGEKKE